MNDLDDRLSDLLTRSAAAVEVRSDVDAVLADDRDAAVVDIRDRPRRTRRVLALAAALLVVLAVVGAVALVADDDRPLDVTDSPLSADDRFPVLGHLPAELQGLRVEANDGEGSHHSAGTSTFHPDTPLVEAAIGKVAADGSVDDVISLVAGAEGLEQRVGPALGEVQEIDAGYRMTSLPESSGWVELYGAGTTVLLTGGPHVEALVRDIAGTGLTATVGPDGRPVLTLRDLPDGYTVTAAPTPPEDRKAEVAIDGNDGDNGRPYVPYVVAETGVGEPSLAVGGGSYRPIDVGGSPGYLASGPEQTAVAWTAPNGVTIRLFTGLGEDEALLVAEGIELVDGATWRATYPELPEGEPPPLDDAVTSHPMVGQPAPEIRGAALGGTTYLPVQETGEWTIVSFTGSWCVPCIEMLDPLGAAHVTLHEEGRASVVSLFVEDTVAAARTLVEDHGVGWPVLFLDEQDAEPWSLVGTFPATVFVDSDGVVRGVVEGTMTLREIDQTLDALGG